MTKKIIVFLLMSITISSFVLIFPSCTAQPQQSEHPGSNLTALIGPQPEPVEVLDAAALEGKSFDSQPPIPVDSILGREAGYEQLYEDMISMVSSFVTNHHPEATGFFHSSVPVYHFRVLTGEVADSADIYVFSQSKDCLGYVSFIADDLSGEISLIFCGSNDIENGDYLQESPSEQFVFLYNGKCNLLLSADNEVYPPEIYKHVDYDYDFSVLGDYSGAIPFDMLSASHNEIVNSLVWTELSES